MSFKRILELEALVYSPGVFNCPKCSFALTKQTISMASGQVGVSQKDKLNPELCPNGCGILEPVTYKESTKSYGVLTDDMFEFLESKNLRKEFFKFRSEKMKEREKNG